MDELLAQFHRLKHVFARTKDGKQRNFNLIRKLHMLRHYTYMIRQFGTPDGLNTEAPERLHINLAKDPYCASNKVDPMEQKATYIQWKEAAAWRRYYLQTSGRTHLEFKYSRAIEDESESEDEDVDDKRGGNVGDIGGEQKRPVFYPEPSLVVAKRNTWPHKTVTCLVTTHKAHGFISAVNKFLSRLHLPPSVRLIVDNTHLLPCWSKATLQHPRLPFKPSEPAKKDVIRASPATASQDASFDTALLLAYLHETGLLST
ncbi:hypothetical protein FRC09_001738 [Ceratobasidium sp. 395]|nr:hypothetical protein FRC09_001738 [Ceratobasidium sp. 395]